MKVEANNVSVEIDGTPIVTSATLTAPAGSILGLIGPNGSGKSSLLRTIYRALQPRAGRIRLDGQDVWELTARESAKRIAVVLQDDSPEFEFTVREVVELGRVPHRHTFDRATQRDRVAVDDAVARAGIASFQDRYIGTLSGGERQRVYLARALAQQTPVLILDEPTNHLDVLAQVELLELLTIVPATVILAMHDLNLTATYCDRILVLADGHVVADGTPADVLTPDLVERVYGVTAERSTNTLTGRPVLHFGPALRHRGKHPGLNLAPKPASVPTDQTESAPA